MLSEYLRGVRELILNAANCPGVKTTTLTIPEETCRVEEPVLYGIGARLPWIGACLPYRACDPGEEPVFRERSLISGF